MAAAGLLDSNPSLPGPDLLGPMTFLRGLPPRNPRPASCFCSRHALIRGRPAPGGRLGPCSRASGFDTRWSLPMLLWAARLWAKKVGQRWLGVNYWKLNVYIRAKLECRVFGRVGPGAVAPNIGADSIVIRRQFDLPQSDSTLF